MKKFLIIILALLVGAGLFAKGVPEEEESLEDVAGSGVPYKAPIDIGTKNFTEQFIAGNMMAILLEDRGYDVNLRTGMITTVLREALENGDVDLCMEYTGTMWLTHTQHEYQGASPREMFEQVQASDAERGIVWVEPPIWCNNTYVIVVTSDLAEEENLETLSDFAEYVNANNGEVAISTSLEFASRPDGLPALEELYGFDIKDDYVTSVTAGLQNTYLIEGDVNATVAFGTDSVIAKYNWVPLQDDKSFWPPYDLAPNTRIEVLEAEANDGLEDVLIELVQAFPSDPAAAREEMISLNAQVDVDKMEPEEVAMNWLEEKGLID